MLDPDVVEECAHCLAGAAVHEGSDEDLALTARALARDLADTQGSRAARLLQEASRETIRWLDASELGRDSFLAALRRLAWIRGRVDGLLAAG